MVYLMLATGFEEIEALTVADVMRRANIDVKLVSCENTDMVSGAHKIAVKSDISLSECSLDMAEMIVLPGGMPGTKNLLNNKVLCDFILSANDKGVKISAICAAPMVLGKLGLLTEKEAVCYPGFESELIGAILPSKRVVSDGNITTSVGPGSAMEFSFRLVEILKGTEISEKLKGDMLVQ